jgi:hypothetical protein
VTMNAPPPVDGDPARVAPPPHAAPDPTANVVADLQRRFEAIAKQEPDWYQRAPDGSAFNGSGAPDDRRRL